MTKTKKLLSVVMTLAMLVGMLTVFATNASAYDEWINVSYYDLVEGTEVDLEADVDLGGSTISSVSHVDGSNPPGLTFGYTSQKMTLIGTPTTPGYYTKSYDVTLRNGKVLRVYFYYLVLKKNIVEKSETIHLKAMEYNDVYLLDREGIDDGVYTDLYFRLEKESGYLPHGEMNYSFGEATPPYVYGTPDTARDFVATFLITLYDGTRIRDQVKFIVDPVKEFSTEETVTFEVGQSYNYYPVDDNNDQYRSVSLVSGSVPAGMDWSYSEVEGVHVYTTPQKAGVYKATWRIVDFAGEIQYHTVNFIVKGSNPFEDVQAGKFYEDPVQWAVNHEPQVTNGTDATHFSPNATCTRGQVVTFLWRALGEPAPKSTTNPFSDVDPKAFYYNAVLWAVEAGVTNGIDATHFGPTNGCTRGQVVTFMWRALGEPRATVTTHPFTDVKEGAFYYDAMLWAVENGVTNGMTANTFAPGATCTRGQIVTFLSRAMLVAPEVVPVNTLDDNFLIYAEDVFTITDRGVVVTGRVANGKVKTNDDLVLRTWNDDNKPVDVSVKALGIEMFHKQLDEAEKGDNIGLQICTYDEKDQILPLTKRGAAIVKAGSKINSLTDYYVGTVTVDPKARRSPFHTDNKFQYYGGALDVTGEFINMGGDFMSDEEIYPGEVRENVVIKLSTPMVWYEGQQVAIRAGGLTLGTFTVTGKISPVAAAKYSAE